MGRYLWSHISFRGCVCPGWVWLGLMGMSWGGYFQGRWVCPGGVGWFLWSHVYSSRWMCMSRGGYGYGLMGMSWGGYFQGRWVCSGGVGGFLWSHVYSNRWVCMSRDGLWLEVDGYVWRRIFPRMWLCRGGVRVTTSQSGGMGYNAGYNMAGKRTIRILLEYLLVLNGSYPTNGFHCDALFETLLWIQKLN